ncbi:MAG: cation diffusion facilitator family transporter [Clostridiales bacterium]
MSIYEGISHILSPNKVSNPIWNYVVLSIAFISEGISWAIAYKEFRKENSEGNIIGAIRLSKDPTVFTVLLEDSAALAGLVVAFLGVFLGQIFNSPYLDGVASIIIGLILAAVSLFLARESKGLLLGESAGRKVIRRIREISESDPAVRAVQGLFTMHLGPDHILLNMNIEFDRKVNLSDLPSIIDRLEANIKKEYPVIDQIFIEVGSLKKEDSLK